MNTLTSGQKQFFDTFGYLALPGLLSEDIGWITDEFAMVFKDKGLVHDPSKRTMFVRFVDSRERLCTLLDHPKVEGALTSLVGDDFNYVGSDGNYYSGDTPWHPDGEHHVGQYVKIAFYLDPVDRETGALRVIPGSHRLTVDWWSARDASRSEELWGIAQRDVPSIALTSKPGDVVIFDHNLMHSAFGGSSQRRMFTMNLSRHAGTPEEIAELRAYVKAHCRPYGPTAYAPTMVETAGPGRWKRLQQVLEQEKFVE